MGRKSVAAKALTWLINRKDVVVVGVITDSHLDVSPTRDIAEKNGIKVFDREQAEQFLLAGSIHIDLAFSVLYWQKIRAPILNSVERGVINFHPAPLPAYKGTAGYNLAILDKLNSWAVSAHYVDAQIDTGPLIEVSEFPIDIEEETAQTLEKKSQRVLLQQFKRVANRALKNKSQLPTYKNSGGRYVGREEMELMKEVRAGDDLQRKIRAFWFPPYSGAYIVIDGVKYTLVDQRILQQLGDPRGSSLFTSAKYKPSEN